MSIFFRFSIDLLRLNLPLFSSAFCVRKSVVDTSDARTTVGPKIVYSALSKNYRKVGSVRLK